MKYCDNDCDQGRRCTGCAGLPESTLTQVAWVFVAVTLLFSFGLIGPVLLDIYRTAAEAGAKAAGY